MLFESSQGVRVLLFRVLYDYVASDHEVRKSMILAKTYKLHSMEAIFNRSPEKAGHIQLTGYFERVTCHEETI